MSAPVLLTWLATRNDPYERVKSGGEFRESPGGRGLGPTLSLLVDPASPYANRIADVVVLRQGGAEAEIHNRVYNDLVEAMAQLAPTVQLHSHVWSHDNPTDHAALLIGCELLCLASEGNFGGGRSSFICRLERQPCIPYGC